MSLPANVIAFPQRNCPQCDDSRFTKICLACGFAPDAHSIQPGIYAARYARHGCVHRFGHWKLWIDVDLPAEGVTLRRWYGLVDFREGRMLAGPRSHLIRELSDALDLRMSPHITDDFLKALRHRDLRARVSKVIKDAEGKPLSALNQYLKVETLLPGKDKIY